MTGPTAADRHGLRIDVRAHVDDAFGLAYGSGGLLLTEHEVGAEFFRLGSGLAGELFQKFVNYRIPLAFVVHEPSRHGPRFAELALEHARHPLIRFFADAESARTWLEKQASS